MSVTIDFDSRELERQLLKASGKIKRQTLLKALRSSGGAIRKAMKSAVPVSEYDRFVYGKSGVLGVHMAGDLQKSIGNITGKSKNFPSIYIGPRVKGSKWKYAGYIGHWVEYGQDTGYNVGFAGRRFVEKGYNAGRKQFEQQMSGKLQKFAAKALS